METGRLSLISVSTEALRKKAITKIKADVVP